MSDSMGDDSDESDSMGDDVVYEFPEWRTTPQSVYMRYTDGDDEIPGVQYYPSIRRREDTDDDDDVPGVQYYPCIRRREDEEPKISAEEEYFLMKKQVEESKGFDIDFAKFCCVFNYKPVDLDLENQFVLEPETTRGLIDRLSRRSLKRFNEINSTKYEFVKVIKANRHVSAGMMFYITFEGKLLNDDDSKLFQAKVCFCYGGIPDYISCELKPK